MFQGFDVNVSPHGIEASQIPDSKFQIPNSRSYSENGFSQEKCLRAAKKMAPSPTARRSRNQEQILRFAPSKVTSFPRKRVSSSCW
jgi:hypothetical protein